ncbi:MAG TPA: lipopolysaccharide kinase InaA family protein [Myxococcota bacterium]|nr:lipopolysaccharide kinase InaA family protein [Myxococcota bacterium]
MRGPVRTVPPGYAVHRVGDAWLVFDAEFTHELVGLRLADPGARKRLFARAPRRGRGAAPSVSLRRDAHVVLRRYQHGGLFRGITRALYLGPSRALTELHVTARAEASGAPVPHVICLALWPAAGPFWSALIGTREERGARDLLDALLAAPDARARRELLREVGAAVRRLHDAGVDHRDLQLHNILAVEEAGRRRIVVVDLDRAVYHPRGALSPRLRARNLGRLTRSAVKAGLFRGPIGKRELSAFIGAYTGTDRRLRAELRGWIRGEQWKLALHRLGYRLWGDARGATAVSPLPRA